MNKDCKIVQDLLPNYLDKLTSNETNEFIEAHLKDCQECSKLIEDMKDENTEVSKTEKYIDFAKKFNKKFNILKIILLIIFVLIIASFSRKAIILSTLENKAKKYETSTNYYSKYYQYDVNSIIIIENYFKDGKYCRKMDVISKETNKNTVPSTEYFDGETHNLYVGSNQMSIGEESDFAIMPVAPIAYYKTSSIMNFIRNCIFSDVKKVNCNGKSCYRFTNLISESLLETSGDDACLYIDEETGLVVRNLGGITGLKKSEDINIEYNTIQDFYYEFDCVTDEDIEYSNN